MASHPTEMSSLVELLSEYARERPDAPYFRFLLNGEVAGPMAAYTVGDVDLEARRIAARLQRMDARGQPVLLLFPPGPAFVLAFFGTLYAGAVAVPAYPPDPARLQRSLGRLKTIVANAGARLVLAPEAFCDAGRAITAQDETLRTLRWVAADGLEPGLEESWHRPRIERGDLAFLQYTSGSTGEPKGVMVTHDNLLHNSELIVHGYGHFPGFRAVIWLPAYHDLGLVGGILQPLYARGEVTLMSPMDFLRRPVRWLRAIDHFQAHTSGGPDFAYQLCLRKVTDEDVASLDLSSWRCAFTGAEPVRAETLRAFARRFAPCGFRLESFYPAYGLAECTLFVSGGDGPGHMPRIEPFDPERLARGVAVPDPSEQARWLVGCGRARGETGIAIVDPARRTRLEDGVVGEIWVRARSIARGYYHRPELTAETFGARLEPDGDGPWLRTGDLGFLREGALFICGRIKDLILYRGRNLFPQDLEMAVQTAHPAIRPGCVAAFGLEIDGVEQPVVVAEIDDRVEPEQARAAIKAVREAIATGLEVELYAVVLVARGSMPKTSSGKLQRFACRDGFLRGTLEEQARWVRPVPGPRAASRSGARDEAGLTARIRESLAVRLGVSASEIDPDAELRSLGLDSVHIAELAAELEADLGTAIDTSTLLNHPTPRALATHLSGRHAASASRARPAWEPIAVIGMGCRLPGGVDSPEALWRLLSDGVDAIGEVPPDRWDIEAWYSPDPEAPEKMVTRWGGFVEGIDRFDPAFFGITPREAHAMDPQQRLLLEVTWDALEDAAIPSRALNGSRTAVYVGISGYDYRARSVAEPTDAYSATGNTHSVTVGRISYLLGLEGPCMAVDTACSSSLIAIHLACRSLLEDEADLALAGGANAILVPKSTIGLSKLRALSPTGRCRPFDAAADGYVRAEGFGTVVLKRLADAQRDGDRILAVVRGSATNQDGRSNGLTAPNGRAQEAVARRALEHAGVAPGDVRYVEAHGTGTPLGDPIELEALGRVFAAGRRDRLLVGSIKSNIGHSECTSGLAGFIKAVQVLEHRQVPPTLHFRHPSPQIPWGELPVEVVTKTTPLEGHAVVGVSSYGIGGSNAHVLLESAPDAPARDVGATRPRHPIVLSARSPEALMARAGRLAAFLRTHPHVSIGDVAHTLAVGRDHLEHRAAFPASSLDEARAVLERLAEGSASDEVATGDVSGQGAPRVAFLFTGQGAQYPGMARSLYESHPMFRASIDASAALLDPLLDRPLLRILFDPETPIDQTGFAQPALFAVELALAELWRAWGVVPELLLGHSVGEIAAACFAGMLSHADAATLVAARARLMQALPSGGAMVSVEAGEREVTAVLGSFSDAISLAAVNGPRQVTLSGDEDSVLDAAHRLEAAGLRTVRLTVSHAFHSARMDPMLAAFREVVSGLTFHPPAMPIACNLTGRIDPDRMANADYWVDQVRGCVRFYDGLQTVLAHGIDLLIEAGPHPVLTGLVHQVPAHPQALGSLRRGHDDLATLLATVCRLHTRGLPLDWAAFDAPWPHRRIALPTYPFQRQRYWLEAGPEQVIGGQVQAHPLLGTRLEVAGRRVFEVPFSIARLPWLSDHRVAGRVVVAAAALLEMARAGASEALGGPVELLEVEVEHALVLEEDGRRRVQLVAEPMGEGRLRIEIFSQAGQGGDGWSRHVRARAAKLDPALPIDRAGFSPPTPDRTAEGSYFYQRMAEGGFQFGPAFQDLRSISLAGDYILATIDGPAHLAGDNGQGIHPALLDAAFQACSGFYADNTGGLYLPVGCERFVLARPAGGPLQVIVHRRPPAGAPGGPRAAEARADDLRMDIELVDSSDALVCRIDGFTVRAVDLELLRAPEKGAPPAARFRVAWRSMPEGASSLSAEARSIAGRWLAVGDAATCDRYRPLLELGPVTLLELDVPDLAASIRSARSGSPGPFGVVLLAPPRWEGPEDALPAAARRLAGAALTIARALGEQPGARLILATTGAQHVSSGDVRDPASLIGAALWGLGRTVAQEAPGIDLRLVDLDPDADLQGRLEVLAWELSLPDAEPQVAWRGDERRVARLAPLDAELLAVPESPAWHLEQRERGVLDSLYLAPTARRTPGPSEVEVVVEAAGLNFRDVLNTLGRYPGPQGPLGGELAGRVIAIGAEVRHVAVGDLVMGVAPHAMGRYVCTDARLVVRVPDGLSATEAATLPIAFLTAWYALYDLAGLKPGERILIHAAAGGVGMAAVQLARRIDAEVFATASRGKQPVVRAMGVDHVYDSRTLEFADGIARDSGGEGIDVVLNALVGDFIRSSLKLLRTGGRFVEMGKAEIWPPERVAEVAPGAWYEAFDLVDVAPERIEVMLAGIVRALEAGELKPLPARVFGLREAVPAFRYMAQARHIGKVVLSNQERPLEVNPDATYLITGGLGALGQVAARWLVDRGARHLLIAGRSRPDRARQAFLDGLEADGASVTYRSVDLADRGEVAGMLGDARRTLPPLRGILHIAGLLEDAPLADQDAARLARVFGPKADAAWWLHLETRDLPLDFFALYASVAGVIGSAGQANYAAANGMLDGLARHRQAIGLPATSIAWGPWDGEGMAARIDPRARLRHLEFGLVPWTAEAGLAELEHALREELADPVLVRLDRARMAERLKTVGVPPLLSEVIHVARGDGAVLKQALEALPPERREAHLIRALGEQTAKVMGLTGEKAIDPRRPLRDLGLDSLMVVDLQNALSRLLGVRLAPTVLFDHPTLERLGRYILTDLLKLELSSAPAPAAVDEDLKGLSEQEAGALLEAELQALEELLQ